MPDYLKHIRTMKKLILVLLFGSIIFTNTAQGQVNINVNLGSQPQWGPAGYNYVEYYYLPDIETYYYVPKKQFVCLNDGRWVFSTSLPSKFNGYDLYDGYKVVLNSPRPYLSFTNHKIKYGKFKGLKGKQATLKNKNANSSPENKNKADIQNGGKGKIKNSNGGSPGNNGNGKSKH